MWNCTKLIDQDSAGCVRCIFMIAAASARFLEKFAVEATLFAAKPSAHPAIKIAAISPGIATAGRQMLDRNRG